jgi:hypothetical protein
MLGFLAALAGQLANVNGTVVLEKKPAKSVSALDSELVGVAKCNLQNRVQRFAVSNSFEFFGRRHVMRAAVSSPVGGNIRLPDPSGYVRLPPEDAERFGCTQISCGALSKVLKVIIPPEHAVFRVESEVIARFSWINVYPRLLLNGEQFRILRELLVADDNLLASGGGNPAGLLSDFPHGRDFVPNFLLLVLESARHIAHLPDSVGHITTAARVVIQSNDNRRNDQNDSEPLYDKHRLVVPIAILASLISAMAATVAAEHAANERLWPAWIVAATFLATLVLAGTAIAEFAISRGFRF